MRAPDQPGTLCTVRAPLPAVLVLCVVMLGSGLVAGCSSSTRGTGALASGVAAASTSRSAPSPAATSGSAGRSRSSTPSRPAPPSSAGHPVPGHPVRTATIVGASGRTYVIKVWAGQPRDRLLAACLRRAGDRVPDSSTTCRAVTRLLATTRVGGRDGRLRPERVVFAGATAEQAYSAAGNFRTLVSKDGTGNINDLLRERLPAAGGSAITCPSPDAFNALGAGRRRRSRRRLVPRRVDAGERRRR